MLGLLKKIPSNWWRKGIQTYLISACAFYILNIAIDLNFIERYRAIFINSYFGYFVFIQIIVILIFYEFLDFLLRLLFHKIIKKKITNFQNKIATESKTEFLKSLTEIKRESVNFLMGYPVELGYIKRNDLQEIASIGKMVFLSRCKQQIAPNQNSTCFN